MGLSVGILGMGRIASGFDAPQGVEINTHVKSVLAEPRLNLTCIADSDEAISQAEKARFGLSAQIMSVDALLKEKLDVICIATPDGTHGNYARRAAGTARLLLVEKPLEGDSATRLDVLRAVEAQGSAIVINHLRRWIPGLQEWMAAARGGEFGTPISAVAHYSRGFRHNGIHAADLVAAFLSPSVKAAQRIAEPIMDYSEADPTLTVLAQLDCALGSAPALFVGVDGRVQTAFSLDLRFEKARIVIFDEKGVRAELHRQHDIGVGGFAHELRATERFADFPPTLMSKVWINIADHLVNGAPLACTGFDALGGYDLLDSIMDHIA
jgi:predicted dehydrogenase